MHATDVFGEYGQANARRVGSPRWFALALFLLTWPWASAAAHDQLTIGIVQFPPALNPDLEAVAAKSYVLGFALRPFTTFDASWKPVCLLCTELPTFENGRAVKTELPGGKTGIDLTYTIRPDATWADGVPVTTDDVKFTYEFGRNKESAVASAEMYREILGIDVKDDKTFTLHWDRLSYNYAAIDDFVLLPAHLERQAFTDPAQYKVRTLYATDPTNAGLYNGPYRIAEFASGSHIVLEPNPHWAGAPPYFKRITIRAIENTAALEANLLSGTIDMIAGEIGLPLDEALAFAQRHGGDYNIIYKPGLTFEHVDCNLDNPVLADRRVREALLVGLDRATLVKTLFAGKQAAADSFVEPLDAGYTDDVPKYPYDPARAKQLLEDAGWHAQSDGTRKNADGKSLSFELTTTAGNRSRELVEQILQSQWKEIGVDIRIHNEPARVLFGETLPHRHFDLAMYAWLSAPENSPRSIFRSDEVPTESNNYAGQNLTDYKNPEMDRLIDALEVELDAGKRKALWAEAQKLYATDLPSLPLYFRSDAFILPKWLTGVQPTGNQSPTTLWSTDWGEKQ
ncbi:MAG TPA: peptide ABC transporter substrate-binding protein [Stellaceae bacterium]|jgi:peptide/nickel transport system substrate-binding protein|nr:peptide ABC transporter substrate-binding protein [Stellaceae bacterium]